MGSAALLAGCGGDSPTPAPVGTEAPTVTATPPPTAPETPEATTTATPAATPTPDPNAPRRGGTLRLWRTGEDAGLDPGIYHLNNRDVIYSTLTQPLSYQPTKNLFAMDGMVGYEQVDPLKLVWSIRPGMKFHNGDPVDSEAVAFSFGRLAKLNEVFEARGDHGTHVRREGYDFVDSFEPADDLTLTEHWSRPNADALVYRARHYYSFLNPRVVQEQGTLEGTYTAPGGTAEDMYSVQDLPFGSGSGPYVLTKRDETGTRVERWPDYHKHIPAGDGFVEDGPYIDTWETRVLPDRTAAKAVFLASDLDVFGPIAPAELSEFEQPHVSVREIPTAAYSVLGMDGSKFHDKRARQALRRAINYEAFIEAVGPPGRRYGVPISDLLPHYQLLSQEQLREWYRYDPKQARELWTAASFDVPVDKLRFLSFDDSRNPGEGRDLFEFLAQSFTDALDIQVEEALDEPQFTRAWEAATDQSEESKGWEILIVNFSGGEPVRVSGIPYESHLRPYDPRDAGEVFFNHHVGSPRREIDMDARTLTEMLVAQDRELHFPSRVELLAEIQNWILDRAWGLLGLPTRAFTHYAFNSRLRDHAPEEWMTSYDLRRESMWLADA